MWEEFRIYGERIYVVAAFMRYMLSGRGSGREKGLVKKATMRLNIEI
jgi:hypothetical protein